MLIPDLTPAEVARFYSKLQIGGCGVLWAGANFNSEGYGRFEIYRGGRVRILAHRLAYKLATGVDPDGCVVRHGCDNPPCCTPDCLTTGSTWDNVHDAIDRGRLIHANLRAAAAERIAVGVKACSRCREVKPLSLFAARPKPRSLDGHVSECGACMADRKTVRRALAEAEGSS